MRPTNVQFRSPKEKTPVGYTPLLTRKGQFLFEAPVRAGSSFGSDRRFRDYQFEAKRVGPGLGPSTYDISHFTVSELRIKGACKYLPVNKSIQDRINAYVMIGDSAVLQDGWSRWKPRILSTTVLPQHSFESPSKRPHTSKRRRSIPRRSATPKAQAISQQFTDIFKRIGNFSSVSFPFLGTEEHVGQRVVFHYEFKEVQQAKRKVLLNLEWRQEVFVGERTANSERLVKKDQQKDLKREY